VPKDEANERRIVKEIAMLHLLHNVHIVNLHDFVINDQSYILFFEYVQGGQLLDFIIHHGRIKEQVARRILIQVIDAIGKYLKSSVSIFA
jgi:serine/threonine protein kinase